VSIVAVACFQGVHTDCGVDLVVWPLYALPGSVWRATKGGMERSIGSNERSSVRYTGAP
jgi:hypothetical protein